MTLHIIDLDGSLPDQKPVAERLGDGRATLHDRRDMGRALRLWAWDGAYRRFASGLPERRAGRTPIVMLGSGDYHHLTPALLQQVEEEVVVVHFDNHPDWAWSFPGRHCGSWVNAALRLPQVSRVITIGCCSDDLAKPDRAGQNLAALRSGRLRMHPWSRPPTDLGRSVGDVPGHVVKSGRLYWKNLDDRPWDAAFAEVMDEIADRPIWISLDKDVLGPDVAATNWDQGRLPVRLLESALSTLLAGTRVAGIDMCGDYSPARHLQPMKWMEAMIDQPRLAPKDLSINEVLNERLLSLFEAGL